jgi:hypothetical protein
MLIKNKLKKILFPFTHKYHELHKYWWHRLLVVIFFIATLVILCLVLISLNQMELDSLNTCMNINIMWDRPIDQGCDVFVVHRKINFLIALLATIVSFYLLQFIYYKILIYIVFGNKFKIKSK